jgi:hypothetical protein
MVDEGARVGGDLWVEPGCEVAFAQSSSRAECPAALARAALYMFQSVWLGIGQGGDVIEKCIPPATYG